MKRSISTAIALAAVFSAPAFAAGPYDGVYQYGLESSYYSVHQNGNVLLVVSLGLLTVNSDVHLTLGPYTIRPTSLGDWDYALGTISENRARISGTDLYGACITTTDVIVENGVANATLISAVTTPFGRSQGVDCEQLFRDLTAIGGTTMTLRKIF